MKYLMLLVICLGCSNPKTPCEKKAEEALHKTIRYCTKHKIPYKECEPMIRKCSSAVRCSESIE